ncbi:MAG: hypothetical protein ACFFAG_19560 [Promethearchaeota archaeon]
MNKNEKIRGLINFLILVSSIIAIVVITSFTAIGELLTNPILILGSLLLVLLFTSMNLILYKRLVEKETI